MDPNVVLGYLGAFGLGSVITAWVNYWFGLKREEKARKLEEKKNAYANFMHAHFDNFKKGIDAKKARDFAFSWIQLVASSKVLNGLETFVRTGSASDYKILIQLMREDLAVDKTRIH